MRAQSRLPKLAQVVVALSSFLAAAPLMGQSMQRDILAGRVVGPKGDPIENGTVSVVALGAPDGTRPLTGRTDSEGRWLVAVQEGPGVYVVRATALGMVPAQDTARRVAERKPIIVDFRLQVAPVVLEGVKVVAVQRTRPPRENRLNDQTAAERFTDNFGGPLAVNDQGNLAAMAATIPGVTMLTDVNGMPGFSMLGLSADQNRVTLNGMQFSGGDIPRDAIAATRVAATSYDVSRGGFSGGQFSIIAQSGGNFHTRLAHLTLDAPALQRNDAVGRALGQPYSNAQISGVAAGPLIYDKLFYNVAAQVGRRSSDLLSVLGGDPFVLERVGVASDSVNRFVGVLSRDGIPVSGTAGTDQRETDNASLLGRIDWLRSQNVVGNVVASVRYNRARASFLGLTAVPSHGGETRTTGGDLTATLSSYLPGNFLNDLRLGVRVNSSRSDPYLQLPDARVLVTSEFADGTTGTTSLPFGGHPLLPRKADTWGLELSDQFSWFTLNRKHRWRATLNLRQDGFTQDQFPNRRGAYFFNSLADLDANHPASYTRVLVGQEATGALFSASASLGDEWRPRDRIQILYGARVDANAFGDHAPRNATVEQRFGARTDVAPSLVDVSPRLGFFWAFGTNGTTGIPGFGAPWGNLRGGIGKFRNDITPTLLAPGMLASGLTTGAQQITCVGSAVPLPDWQAFMSNPGSIPSQCAGDTNGSPFASTRPNVWMVDSRFGAQTSWRGNLALGGFVLPKAVRFTLEGVYSVNRQQQAPVDLNFNPQQRFALGAEGDRPVYVPAASIVPATGALTNRDSRRDAEFAGVTQLRSDLESRSRQFIVTVFPAPGNQLGKNYQWGVSYVNQQVREETRGFSGTTAGNPLDAVWGRSAQDFRHQVNLSYWARVGSLFSVTAVARFQSGAPFTPMVGGDVNGDGLANDRAFIFAPSSPGVGSGMSSLLAGAPVAVRDCLERQSGRLAAQNSCEGPWTGNMNAVFILNPQLFGWQNRAQVSLSFTNVLAGFDELLHGIDEMHGWGQPSTGDPTLLYVRGFDAGTGRFTYEVNQRFGDTRLSRTGTRAPFFVTLETRIQLGKDFNRQAVNQAIAPGRTRKGDKLPPQQIRNRILNSIANPVRGLLQSKDSLSILTNAQLEQLVQLERQVTARQDSVVTPLVQYLTALPDRYDESTVMDRVLVSMNALFDIVVDGMRQAGKIFTQEQIDEFPPALRAAFSIQRLEAARPVKGFFPNY